MAQTVQHPSLDLLGMTAAVYPSEDQLWAQGPPVNDPGGQGVEGFGDDGSGGIALQGPPPVPSSLAEAQQTEEWLDEQLNGETPNGAIDMLVVNSEVYGPQGYGNFNEAPFDSGHTQMTVSNPSEEQGWGVGPARRWAHYPIQDNPNPARNRGTHMRNGALPWVTADSYLYERSGLAWEEQFSRYKQRVPVNPVVNVAPSVPFTQTVPTYGGGDIPIAGVDQPYEISDPAMGIY